MRWKDQIEEALPSIGVNNWRRRARSRGAWKNVLRQAELRKSGCYGQLSKYVSSASIFPRRTNCVLCK